MDSPPLRPKTAIPSHLTNGPSPLSTSTEARHKKEREDLFAAIENSNRGRAVVDFDAANGPNGHFSEHGTSTHFDSKSALEKHSINHNETEVERWRRDAPARTPLATSRAQSPYTQHPTIDFDGLSWPSTYSQDRKRGNANAR